MKTVAPAPMREAREAKAALKDKIDTLPPALVGEVDDFVEFVTVKRGRETEPPSSEMTSGDAQQRSFEGEQAGDAEEGSEGNQRESKQDEGPYSALKMLRDAKLSGPADASVTYEEKLYGASATREDE